MTNNLTYQANKNKGVSFHLDRLAIHLKGLRSNRSRPCPGGGGIACHSPPHHAAASNATVALTRHRGAACHWGWILLCMMRYYLWYGGGVDSVVIWMGGGVGRR
jgi:hypothetical protein